MKYSLCYTISFHWQPWLQINCCGRHLPTVYDISGSYHSMEKEEGQIEEEDGGNEGRTTGVKENKSKGIK